MPETKNNTKQIEIGHADLDIYVSGQKVLHIGQVSDKDTINLWLYSKTKMIKPAFDDKDCLGELLIPRKSTERKLTKVRDMIAYLETLNQDADMAILDEGNSQDLTVDMLEEWDNETIAIIIE